MRTALQCLALPLLVLLSGCPGDGGPGALPEPKARFIAPGSGPTNERPLVALTAGTRKVFDDGTTHSVVGPVKVGGTTLVLDQWSEGTTNYWRQTHQGWFVAWTNGGPVAEPVLIYPHTIRVGMIWESGGYQFEVKDRQENQPTLFGPRTCWTVTVNQEDDRIWAEGVGELSRTNGYNTDRLLVSGVLPTEERLAPEPDLAPLALTPLPVESATGENVIGLEVYRAGLLDDGSGRPVILLEGNQWTVANIVSRLRRCIRALPTLAELDPAPPPGAIVNEAVYGQDVVGCPAWSYPYLSDPTSVWIDPEGMAYYLASDPALLQGRTIAATLAPPGADVPWQLNQIRSGWSLLDWVDQDDPAFYSPESHHGEYRERSLLLDWLGAEQGSRDLQQITPPTLLTPRHPLLRRFISGLIAEHWLEPDGALADARVTTHLGAIHAWARHGERGWLSTYPDGRIDRVTMSGASVGVERLGRVTLPAGQALGAAVPFERDGEPQLLVLTTDRTYPEPAAGRPYALVSRLFTAPLAAAAVPRDTTQALTVVHGASGLDAQVCWRPIPGEVFDSSGWTLGGAPAADARAYDPGCALIVRDVDAALDPSEPGGTLLTGTLPGVGPVEVALPLGPMPLGISPPGSGEYSTVYVQVLATGGLVGERMHWGPGGWLHGYAESEVSAYFHGSYPDLEAKGIWGTSAVGAGLWEMMLDDAFSMVTSDASWGEPHVVGSAADGGVVILATTGNAYLWHVDPLGHATDLGVEAGLYSGATVLADGTVCAVGNLGWFPYKCWDAEGTVREPEPVTEMPIWGTGLYLLPDGAIFLPGFTGEPSRPGAILDPVTMTHETLGTVPTRQHRYRPGGRLYAVTGATPEADPPPEAVEVTAAGLVPVPLPDFRRYTGCDQGIAAVLPERDHLYVVLVDGLFFRVPYPD